MKGSGAGLRLHVMAVLQYSRPVVRKLGPVAKFKDPKPSKPAKPVKPKKLDKKLLKDAARLKKKEAKRARAEVLGGKAAAALPRVATAVKAAAAAEPLLKVAPTAAPGSAAGATAAAEVAQPSLPAAPAAPPTVKTPSTAADAAAESTVKAVASEERPPASGKAAAKAGGKGKKNEQKKDAEKLVRNAGKAKAAKEPEPVLVDEAQRMEAPPGLPPHIAVHLPPKRSHKKMTPEQRVGFCVLGFLTCGMMFRLRWPRAWFRATMPESNAMTSSPSSQHGWMLNRESACQRCC